MPITSQRVFRSGIPIVMSGLEVCLAAGVPLDAYSVLAGGGKASRLTLDLLDFYAQYSRDRGPPYTAIYDLTPVIQMLRVDLFTGMWYAVDVETEGALCRGMTVVDFEHAWGGPQTTYVLKTVDRDAYVEVFLKSIRRLDRRIAEREPGSI